MIEAEIFELSDRLHQPTGAFFFVEEFIRNFRVKINQ